MNNNIDNIDNTNNIILTDREKYFYTTIYVICFIISQIISIFGSLFTLPYKNLTIWEAYKMVIPYGLIGCFFATTALYIIDKYNFIKPTSLGTFLSVIQLPTLLIINKYYLKQEVTYSQIIGFILIFIAFYFATNNMFSKLLGYNHEEPGTNKENKKNQENNDNKEKIDREKNQLLEDDFILNIE